MMLPKIRPQNLQKLLRRHHQYTYTQTSLLHSTTKTLSTKPSTKSSSPDDQLTEAQKYNIRRSAYKKSVSKLRTQYAAEIAVKRQSDLQTKAQQRAQKTRRRLERQRIKTITSVQNAVRQEQSRRRAEVENRERLEATAKIRAEKRRVLHEARKLLIDELEEDAVHWLATKEEVNSKLNDRATVQQLWAHAGGYVGSPDPSPDSSLWSYDAHTWEMDRTYITPRELWLEEFERDLYDEENMDERYWTEERLVGRSELEEKAKLRALVKEEGRRVLLNKQKQFMQDVFAESNAGTGFDDQLKIPKKMPAPSLGFLANDKAMEEEGVKALKEDPTRFFEFMDDNVKPLEDGLDADQNEDDDDTMINPSKKASLGRPIGLRDPTRTHNGGLAFPRAVGRMAPPDVRTAREKKQDEREQRMWAAAQAEQASGVAFAAEDSLDDGTDPIDYNELGNAGDELDRAWEEGLDEEVDKELLSAPREERYTEEDTDWFIEQLEKKMKILNEENKALEQEKKEGMSSISTGYKEEEGVESEFDSVKKTQDVDDKGREYTNYEIYDDDEVDALLEQLEKEDNMEGLQSIVDSLNEEQLKALQSLDATSDGEAVDADSVKKELSKVPGLSEEQIESLAELELSLSANEELKKKFSKK